MQWGLFRKEQPPVTYIAQKGRLLPIRLLVKSSFDKPNPRSGA